MKLKRFRVTNFRSVEDSDWIDVADVTAFIGINESGKTNLLLPLWKLNPAREGEIQPTSDYPKKLFGQIRAAPGKYCFATAEFDLNDTEAEKFAKLTSRPAAKLHSMHVKRFYDGALKVEFPNCSAERTIAATEVKPLFESARTEIASHTPLESEEGLRDQLVEKLNEATSALGSSTVDGAALTRTSKLLLSAVPAKSADTSTMVPRFRQVIEKVEQIAAQLSAKPPGELEPVLEEVKTSIPKFLYYSTYGNLDSEIYLPHVVQNLKRTDLGTREAAKARTLRILFKFVQLSPDEILELGRDFKDPANPAREPNATEIAAISEKKRERSILLQSAGATLTSRFKEWWPIGDYRFRFEADGNHFRIWVSDDRRPEEIELESRSTGLQWFLSFYLVFLVEAEEAHRDAVLLLDEAGLSLHPLAQRQLSEFFEGLAKTNQTMYTTHSPFLVDADHLDRARKVFVAADGTTKATDDLRQATPDDNQAGAAYAVYSALNLNVAESLLLGCQPIIVEGRSDQHYLTTIKTLLIGAGKITPKRELVFPPSGGTKTARITASILTGRDESLPMVLLDSDEPGVRMANELKSNLYVDAKDRVLLIGDFTGLEGSEIEDLFPPEFIARAIDRVERGPEKPFADTVQPGKPIVPQIKAWANAHGITLDTGWKVELAKRVKQSALQMGLDEFDGNVTRRWLALFQAFE